jgi:HAD superfamily hydrolase (TIGR01509 family)
MPAPSDRPVKAVIFDIGGIMEPSFDDVLGPEVAGLLAMSRERFLARRAAAAVALSEGRMTLRDFYQRLGEEGGWPVDASQIVARHLDVYAAATAEFDPQVLALIARLRRRHLVACLTNTEIEVAEFNRQRGLFARFDRAFLSTDLGLHKPDRAIFERALAGLGCAAAEAVFTDDKLENTAGARAAGMHAIHYRDFEGFSRQLAGLIGPGF